jgi:DNA invertase Pin-like site-specific DNA recombinase
MQGQRIGYKRVSTVDQTTARQLEGVQVDKVFEDKASGKDTERPQLQLALEFVREGDTLVVWSMDRLARNLDDLRKIVKTLTGKGVKVEFVKESLTFTGDDNPMSNLLLSVMGAFAEFERALIRERQKEGIALAKKAGVYKGRKATVTGERLTELLARIKAGEKRAALAREYGISRETLYSYIAKASNGTVGANSVVTESQAATQ